MKKSFLLLSAAIASMNCMAATPADGLTPLLPSGVKANVSQEQRVYGVKNIAIAGSAEKGYHAYFTAEDADHGEELWVTDGTPEGTRMVKDINPGVATSNIQWLTRFNDKVVFSATSGEDYGQEAWISDGTEEGTYMIADIHEVEGSDPVGFCQLDETRFVFFAKNLDSEAMNEAGEKWLYISDGTEEGTSLVAEVDGLWLGREAGDNRWGCVVRVGRKVFFIGDDADKAGITHGDELWVTDGTAEGTHMVKDINLEENKNELAVAGSTNGAAIAHLQNFYNEKLFFKAWSMDSGNEPWATDGTEEGTYEIFNTVPTVNPDNGIGEGGGVTKVGAPYKGNIMFRSRTPETGNELGRTNCEKGDYSIYDIDTYAPSSDSHSFPDDGVEFDGKYMFCANSGTRAGVEDPVQRGGELHVFDGEKVFCQYDFNPGTGCDWVKELTVCGGSLYWWCETPIGTTPAGSLIRLDKWDEAPVFAVDNIDANNNGIRTLRNLNGDLIFFSTANNQIYCYHYRQPGYDPSKNPDEMEINFLTRSEMGGIDDIVADNGEDAPAVYYNLQGVRVNATTPGLYIRREGSKATKVIIK